MSEVGSPLRLFRELREKRGVVTQIIRGLNWKRMPGWEHDEPLRSAKDAHLIATLAGPLRYPVAKKNDKKIAVWGVGRTFMPRLHRYFHAWNPYS